MAVLPPISSGTMERALGDNSAFHPENSSTVDAAIPPDSFLEASADSPEPTFSHGRELAQRLEPQIATLLEQGRLAQHVRENMPQLAASPSSTAGFLKKFIPLLRQQGAHTRHPAQTLLALEALSDSFDASTPKHQPESTSAAYLIDFANHTIALARYALQIEELLLALAPLPQELATATTKMLSFFARKGHLDYVFKCHTNRQTQEQLAAQLLLFMDEVAKRWEALGNRPQAEAAKTFSLRVTRALMIEEEPLSFARRIVRQKQAQWAQLLARLPALEAQDFSSIKTEVHGAALHSLHAPLFLDELANSMERLQQRPDTPSATLGALIEGIPEIKNTMPSWVGGQQGEESKALPLLAQWIRALSEQKREKARRLGLLVETE